MENKYGIRDDGRIVALPPIHRRRRVAVGWMSKRALLCFWDNGFGKTNPTRNQGYFLTPSARRDTHLFGGLGLKMPREDQINGRIAMIIVECVQGTY